MTHAFVALAHGDLAAALAASPLGALLAGGAWLYALADLARGSWPAGPSPTSRPGSCAPPPWPARWRSSPTGRGCSPTPGLTP